MAGALRFRCGEDLSLGLRIAYAGVSRISPASGVSVGSMLWILVVWLRTTLGFSLRSANSLRNAALLPAGSRHAAR